MALRKFLFMSTEGYYQEAQPTDSLDLGGLTMGGTIDMSPDGGTTTFKITNVAPAAVAGDALVFGQSGATLGDSTILGGTSLASGKSLTLSGGGTITGLPLNPTGATEAASKSYVDSVAQGLNIHPPADALANTNISTLSGLTTTVDGVPLDADGMRVLLNGQTSAVDNGIYVVHSGAWTRAADMAVGYHAAGTFVFIHTGGTVFGATGWVANVDNPNDVVGTNADTFIQFSGAGTYLATGGLKLVGNTFSVDLNTNPGLQVTANKLEAKPDNARGMAKDASGLFVEVDNTTITFNGSGALVATNAQSAIYANRVENSVTAGTGGVSAGDPVYVSANNTVAKADTDSDAHSRCIGLALTNVAATNPVEIVSSGPIAGVITGATAGQPYYVATGGGITTSTPGAGKRVIRVGVAISATDLFVQILDYGKKAA